LRAEFEAHRANLADESARRLDLVQHVPTRWLSE
jgi:hypothetical protein